MGRRINAKRRELGLSLSEVARACGVSFQQIHKYETGECALSAAQLWNVAKVLNTPVGYFFEEISPDSGGSRQE